MTVNDFKKFIRRYLKIKLLQPFSLVNYEKLGELLADLAGYIPELTGNQQPDSDFVTIPYSDNITWDGSVSNNATLTLAGSPVITITNARKGVWYTLIVSQDSTGGHAPTIQPMPVKTPTGILQYTIQPNKIDMLRGIYTGATWYWTIINDMV